MPRVALPIGERIVDAGDACKAILQDQFRVRLDFRRRIDASARRVSHREGERGVGHIVDRIADVGGYARRGLAALLGADAGDDEMIDLPATQPEIEAGIGERVVRVFFEDHGGRARQPLLRHGKAGFPGERTSLADVKDMDDWNAGFARATVQTQDGALEGRQIGIRPVGV